VLVNLIPMAGSSKKSKATANPEARRVLRDTQKLGMSVIYKGLAQKMKLATDQTDKLNDLLADHIMNNVDQVTTMLRDKPTPEQMDSLFAAQDATLQQQVEALLGQDGLAQLLPLAAGGGVDLILAQRVGKGPAAEHVAVMAFLVGPGDSLDAEPDERIIGGDGAGQFEPVDDAERAVEPAAMRLGLAVRSDQQPSGGVPIAADHVADAVDHRIEPGLGEFLDEPLARGDVVRRVGRPVHPGLVASEIGEALQIGDDPLAIGSRHLPSPRANMSAI
jgi:hypothetical protein